MNKLYFDFESKVYDYGGYPSSDHERNLINSLDNFLNELYSKEHYSNKSYMAICEMKNVCRNTILLIINDFTSNKLRQFPNSIEQMQILIRYFYDKKLNNPVIIEGSLMRSDLEKSIDERKYTNEEWDAKIDLAMDLAKYWDGESSSSFYDIYNLLFKEYPRVNILKHWNYGFDPQSFMDVDNSLNERLGQSTYLKEAEQFLNDKYGVDDIPDIKRKNSNVYHELLFNALTDRFNSYKFYDYLDHYDSSEELGRLNFFDEIEEMLNDNLNKSNSVNVDELSNDDLEYEPSMDPMAQAEALIEEASNQSNSNRVSEFLERNLASELIDPNSVYSDSK